MDRRHALLGGLAASGLSAAGWRLAAPASAAPVPGRLMGADAALGHRLRAGDFPEPDGETRTGVVIVGGGVAGLSAAWQLQARGLADVTLLELEREVGGNAASGANAVSAYPWGAHYVPLLTREATHAQALFEALGIITGRAADGDPVYNEFYLCADPRERLYALGRWQDDLLPQLGVSDADRAPVRGFFAAMAAFRARAAPTGARRSPSRSTPAPPTRRCARWTARPWPAGCAPRAGTARRCTGTWTTARGTTTAPPPPKCPPGRASTTSPPGTARARTTTPNRC